MAERRMFNKTVLQEEKFIEQSNESKCLYAYLMLNADDMGVVSNAKTICRMVNLPVSSLTELESNGYVANLEEGIYVIAHWFVHNNLDRYKLNSVHTYLKEYLDQSTKTYQLENYKRNPKGKVKESKDSVSQVSLSEVSLSKSNSSEVSNTTNTDSNITNPDDLPF